MQLGKSLEAELKMAKITNVGIHNLSPGMVTTELLMSGANTPTAKFFINCLGGWVCLLLYMCRPSQCKNSVAAMPNAVQAKEMMLAGALLFVGEYLSSWNRSIRHTHTRVYSQMAGTVRQYVCAASPARHLLAT